MRSRLAGRRPVSREIFRWRTPHSRKRGGVAANLRSNSTQRQAPRAQRHPWFRQRGRGAAVPPEHDGEVVECRDPRSFSSGSASTIEIGNRVAAASVRERAALNADFPARGGGAAVARRRGTGDKARRPGAFPATGVERVGDLPGSGRPVRRPRSVVQIQTRRWRRTLRARRRGCSHGVMAPARSFSQRRRRSAGWRDCRWRCTTHSGRPWNRAWVAIDGFDYWLDLPGGQRPGSTSTSARSMQRWANLARGAACSTRSATRALRAHAARAGAKEVLGFRQRGGRIAAARGMPSATKVAASSRCERVRLVQRPGPRRATAVDVIVLDPPPFAKSKSALEGRCAVTTEINLRAQQRLAPGGVLATY